MNEIVDRIRTLCKEHGMSLASLEKELGFANGSLAKSDEKMQAVRAKAIADYFDVATDYLLTGVEQKETSTLDEDEMDLVVTYRELNRKLRHRLMAYAYELSEYKNKGDDNE